MEEGLIVQLSADIKGLQGQLKEAQKSLKDYVGNTEKGATEVASSFDKIGSSIKNLIGVYVSLQAAQALLTNSFNTSLKLDAIENSFAAIFSSAEEGERQFERLKRKAEELGLSITSLADSYKLFAGATIASGMSIAETNRIFDSVAKTSAVLKLSSEETEGALRALAQMMGKGTVQAEELRGQLGERIPGAFKLAANAMGVTEKELGKMLEQGQVLATDLLPKLAGEFDKTFGDKVKGKVTGLSAEWERFKNNFTLAVEATNIGAVFESFLRSLNKITTSKTWQNPIQFRADKAYENLVGAIETTKTRDELNKLIVTFTQIKNTLQKDTPLWNAYNNAILDAGAKIKDLNSTPLELKANFDSLDSLKKELKIVNDKIALENPNSATFANLVKQAEMLEKQIDKIVLAIDKIKIGNSMKFTLDNVNPMAEVDLSMLQAAKKEVSDFDAQVALLTQNLKELGVVGQESFNTITNTTPPTEAITELSDNAQNLVNILGNGLSSAFEAALINGQNFTQVFIKALGDMIKKLIAAVAAAAILSAILAAASGGTSTFSGVFGKVFSQLTGFNFGGAGASGQRVASAVPTNGNGNVSFEIRGDALFGVLTNYQERLRGIS